MAIAAFQNFSVGVDAGPTFDLPVDTGSVWLQTLFQHMIYLQTQVQCVLVDTGAVRTVDAGSAWRRNAPNTNIGNSNQRLKIDAFLVQFRY